MALLNRGHRREIEETVRKIEKIETALESKFQEHFVNAMAMPNKVDAFPKLAEVVALPERKVLTDDGEGGGRRRRRDYHRGPALQRGLPAGSQIHPASERGIFRPPLQR